MQLRPPEHQHWPGPSLAPVRSRQSPTLSDRLSSTRPQLQVRSWCSMKVLSCRAGSAPFLQNTAAGRPHMEGHPASPPPDDGALSGSCAHHESSTRKPTSSDSLCSEPSPSWRCTARQPRQCWSRKASYRLRYSGIQCWRSPCRQRAAGLGTMAGPVRIEQAGSFRQGAVHRGTASDWHTSLRDLT